MSTSAEQVLITPEKCTRVTAAATVLEGRKAGEEIVKGEDDRLLVVRGRP